MKIQRFKARRKKESAYDRMVRLHKKKTGRDLNAMGKKIKEINTPSDREWGTTSLRKIYAKATPGQSENITETWKVVKKTNREYTTKNLKNHNRFGNKELSTSRKVSDWGIKSSQGKIIWGFNSRNHALSKIKELKEDVVPIANAAGNGGIDGIGVGSKGEPGISKKVQKMIQNHKGKHVLRRRKFAGQEVFEVDSSTFHKATFGKKKFKHWKRYIGESDLGDEIREFAYKHPNKPIIVQHEMTGAMQYLRYGKR